LAASRLASAYVERWAMSASDDCPLAASGLASAYVERWAMSASDDCSLAASDLASACNRAIALSIRRPIELWDGRASAAQRPPHVCSVHNPMTVET
jgi:hypothetical protein